MPTPRTIFRGGTSMPRFDIVRESAIVRTPRLLQLEGVFDLPPSQRSVEEWHVDFELPGQWNVGVIVGPSGSGKTTVAREMFGEQLVDGWAWPEHKSIVDGFPAEMGIKDITGLLSSVGFSSPPSWVRPFAVLSNGEQFRVNMARTLAEMPEMAVVDEFTSVVDRTVAQIGSAAIAKTVRRRVQKFVAVSCHYDILEWLEPDWIYQPHINQFELARGRLQRPLIELEIKRVHHSAWQLFRKHHYLDQACNRSARCFVAFWKSIPVAFASVLYFPHPKIKGCWRGHRTVCLPDFQGVGIGNAFSDYMGAVCRGMGFRYISQTTHPSMIRARALSPNWRMRQSPTYKRSLGMGMKSLKLDSVRTRLVASFNYVGAALPSEEARRIWNGC